MRGFPLLNTVAVLGFFLVAWWPLRSLVGERGSGVGTVASSVGMVPPREVRGAPEVAMTLRVRASHPLERLTVEHLGEVVISLEAPGLGLEEEHRIGPIGLPREGIEFWVDAEFAPGESGGTARCALGIEVVPDATELEPRQVTLWSGPGEKRIADLARYDWAEWGGEGK